MISDIQVENIRSYNRIESVAGEFVSLYPANGFLAGQCPCCHDAAPTFIVDPRKQTFTCFHCGFSGDVFAFVQNAYGISYKKAAEALAKRAGLQFTDEPEPEMIPKTRALLLEMNKQAAKYYIGNLRKSRKGKEYIKERELSEKTVKSFGIGYANGYDNDLTKYLKYLGYSEEQIIMAGLGVQGEHGIRDKYRERIMFPIVNTDKKVVGFGGRTIIPDAKPKYINSPDTLVFDKSSNLFGINTVIPGKPIILCEGYMDVIQMQQWGFNGVASLGTAFTSLQAKLLRKYTDTVILSYDSDGPGQIALKRAAGILEKFSLNYKKLELMPAKDPDEFLKKFGKEEFEKRLI